MTCGDEAAEIGCVLSGIIGLNIATGLGDAGNDSVLASVGAGLYIMLIGAGLAAAATVAHSRSS